jgi:hypothetical protein
LPSRVGIRLHSLYIDRGFPGSPVVKVLERLGVNWIAGFQKNDKVKAVIKDAHRNGGFVRDYEMGPKNAKVNFNLVLVKSRGYNDRDAKVVEKYSAFATNLPVKEEEREQVIENYRKRWSIETGYRVKKEFKIKTSTRVYSMKILFFFLSVVMYNLWVLLNHNALLTTPGLERPLVTTDRVKFYYQLELFSPSILEQEEEYARLHRKWSGEGLIPTKITVI